MDKLIDKTVETFRSGHFTFRAVLDLSVLEPLCARVKEAYWHVASGPDSVPGFDPEEWVEVTSIYGSNTIEGGLPSEAETQEILLLSPDQIKEEQAQRIVNLKAAYQFALEHAAVKLDEEIIKKIHALINHKLSHPYNQGGAYRHNTKENHTVVGNIEHSGVYKPPKCHDDIVMLMRAFVEWANSEAVLALSPLYRAPLIHLYFELIHPFWDGNGRTGRIIEAMVLQQEYSYIPHAMSGFYLKNIHAYFSLFNYCRKKSENTPFVKFFLEGLLETFHEFYIKKVATRERMAFAQYLLQLESAGKINKRQLAIMDYLRKEKSTEQVDKKLLTSQAWYQALYSDYHAKTKERDLKQLEALRLISLKKVR